jgi:hypothetical protein
VAKLTIEWRHFAKEGETCARCSATGNNLIKVIADLIEDLKQRDVEVSFIETKLTEEQMAESNLILFNDVPIEDLLSDAEASENSCASCSCLTVTETSCRTVMYDGQLYEEIPENLIRSAAYKAAGLVEM